ncbi:hypothetical protein ACE6H2_003738 [Prunus campanulata]
MTLKSNRTCIIVSICSIFYVASLLAKYFSTEQSVTNICCCLTVLTAKLLSKVNQRETGQHKISDKTQKRKQEQLKQEKG